MRKSNLKDAEIVKLYSEDVDISKICELANISRPAVYSCLKRNHVKTDRRELKNTTCPFCNKQFTRPASRIKGQLSGYCSIQCFHADRSVTGIYSKRASQLASIKPENSEHFDRIVQIHLQKSQNRVI